MHDAAAIVEEVRRRCLAAGLDLVQPFEVARYNCAVEPLYRLPDYGRQSTLGMLIGNTRLFWPRFIAALLARPQLLAEKNPLDTFVQQEVLSALRSLSVRREVRCAHELPPRRVAMQRLAQIAGLAYLSPSCLSVHATYGPWIALRAAVVIDVDGPVSWPPDALNPCTGCESDCLPKFREALAATGSLLGRDGGIEQHWQLWLAVRDACPVGRSHRYGDEQIGYHYTKDVSILKRLVDAGSPCEEQR